MAIRDYKVYRYEGEPNRDVCWGSDNYRRDLTMDHLIWGLKGGFLQDMCVPYGENIWSKMHCSIDGIKLSEYENAACDGEPLNTTFVEVPRDMAMPYGYAECRRWDERKDPTIFHKFRMQGWYADSHFMIDFAREAEPKTTLPEVTEGSSKYELFLELAR